MSAVFMILLVIIVKKNLHMGKEGERGVELSMPI